MDSRQSVPSKLSYEYLISPPSLLSWFNDFVDLGPDDRTLPLDEGLSLESLEVQSTVERLGPPNESIVVVCASHDSLERDAKLASSLRLLGYQVNGIADGNSYFGTDKVRMKTAFQDMGLRTPRWELANTEVASLDLPPEDLVLKSRWGTQGLTNYRLDSELPSSLETYFVEEFVKGEEYSVIAAATRAGVVTFPPVWKGPTREDLLPPYKRLRICPDDSLDSELEMELREATVRISEQMGLLGPLEVEYVVSPQGSVYALEVNPRVAGTLRMSALTAAAKPFSIIASGGSAEHLSASRITAEMPFSQVGSYIPSGVFFTSRMTVSAASKVDLWCLLEKLVATGTLVDDGTIEQLKDILYGVG